MTIMTRAQGPAGPVLSSLLHRYYRAPEHVMKQRVWSAVRRRMRHRRLTLPYGDGGWITLDERDWIDRNIFLRGAYESEVWFSLVRSARRDDVVWDVGAHIGSVTIRALQDRRVARVYAFEPDPVTADVLEYNLGLNAGRWAVYRIGLSDRREDRELTRGPRANSGLSSLGTPGDGTRFRVSCRTADELIQTGLAVPPTLMKIDVEGWELNVMRGAAGMLRSAPPRAIVFESAYDRSGNPVPAELPELLQASGYDVCHVARPGGVIEERENYLAVHVDGGSDGR